MNPNGSSSDELLANMEQSRKVIESLRAEVIRLNRLLRIVSITPTDHPSAHIGLDNSAPNAEGTQRTSRPQPR